MRVYMEDDTYHVESSGGGFYVVDKDMQKCSCPDFKFRRKGCKHIEYLKSRPDGSDGCIRHVEENSFVDRSDLEDEFGKGLVDALLYRGELSLEDGKVYVFTN
jgi:hypothetical protein